MTPAQLRDHLLRAHRRAGGDVDRVGSGDLHRLEHAEQALGLVVLDHDHGGTEEPVGTPTATVGARLH